jgi:hypothetical protein
MLDPELFTEAIQRRADTLQRHARPANSGEGVVLGKTFEGDRSAAVSRDRGGD